MESCEQAIWWHVYPLGACGAPIRPGEGAPGEGAPGEPETAEASPSDGPAAPPSSIVDETAPTTAEPRLRRLLAWLDYARELGATGLLLGPVFQSTSHGYDTTDYFRIDERLGSEADFDDLVSACRERGLRLFLDGVFSHVGSAHPLLARALAEGPDSPQGRLFHIDWTSEGGPYPWFFEGHPDLVRFDHSHEEAADYVAEVMRHWLARGIDGWRLDAAYSVPSDFWARVLPRVRAEFPGAFFLGEVIHGDYPAIVAETGMDTVTQYELWKAIWSSLKEKNFFELDWTLQRHNAFLESFTPQTFVGNHDVTRIASTLGPEGAVAALAILLTVGGTPSIYYGDEQGFTGVKADRAGGDDEVRPPLPAAPSALSALGAPMFEVHRSLIALRRARPWLTTATTEALELTNTTYRYRASARDGAVSLEVVLDVSGSSPRIAIHEDGAVIWYKG
ncbi:alpha-amylase family protein [Actinomyces culturomici]|uniref:alpha-amylase family protein n=1 Tax=Actinomyces culturomici TaxID=1926276 RepID=UPI000E206F17|nr:alpha-amylase family protein [Actinomyces culturomici]